MSDPAPLPSEAIPSQPPVLDPNVFPNRHRPLRQWLLDHNPCLLISTVLMLLGCYLINGALRGNPWTIKMFALLAIINVYEACIIPLGLMLVRRTHGTARDGLWLILFEILFLVNGTFINPDLVSTWGILLNLALFFLACTKAAIIMHYLKIGLHLRTFGFLCFQLGIIYGLPIFLRAMQPDGTLPASVMYALWWLIGLLPLAYDQLAKFGEINESASVSPQWHSIQLLVRRVYLMAPWVMLVAHLGFSHWAFRGPFILADISPLLLGLAIASARLSLPGFVPALARVLPACALVLALVGREELALTVRFAGESHAFTPLLITFAGVVITYCQMASQLFLACGLTALFLASVIYLFQSWIANCFRSTFNTVASALPATALSWGITAIAGAFVTLAIGLFVALKRTKPPLSGSSP